MYIFNRITVNPQLPKRIEKLSEIANNLWWSWNTEFLRLFQKIDNDLWEQSSKNPFKFLKHVSQDRLEKEIEILKAQAMNEGKPAEIAEKMVQGRIGKFYGEICLVEQEFVKAPDVKVGDLAKQKGCEIVRFARLEKGEGLQKKEENFAEEVAKQING